MSADESSSSANASNDDAAAASLSPAAARDVVSFLHTVGRLKSTPRTGWLDAGLPASEVESVSDHMYRVALLCMMCPDTSLDRDRLVRLALCHDVGECIIGDISPRMRVAKAEKQRRETAAIASLAALLTRAHAATFAGELTSYFAEYEAQTTREAQFVRDMDLLEMVVQAHQYEHAHHDSNLDSFFASGQALRHSWARAVYASLCSTRARDGAVVPTLPPDTTSAPRDACTACACMYDIGDVVAHELVLQQLLPLSRSAHDSGSEDGGDSAVPCGASTMHDTPMSRTTTRRLLRACVTLAAALACGRRAMTSYTLDNNNDNNNDDDNNCDGEDDVYAGTVECVRVMQLHHALVAMYAHAQTHLPSMHNRRHSDNCVGESNNNSNDGNDDDAARTRHALPGNLSLYVRAYGVLVVSFAALWRRMFATHQRRTTTTAANDDDDDDENRGNNNSRSSMRCGGGGEEGGAVPWHVCLDVAQRRWLAHLQHTTRELLTRLVATRQLPLCYYAVYMLYAHLDGCATLLRCVSEVCVHTSQLCASRHATQTPTPHTRSDTYVALSCALAASRSATHATRQLTRLWQRYCLDDDDDACGGCMQLLWRLSSEVTVRATLLHGQHIARATRPVDSDDDDDDGDDGDDGADVVLRTSLQPPALPPPPRRRRDDAFCFFAYAQDEKAHGNVASSAAAAVLTTTASMTAAAACDDSDDDAGDADSSVRSRRHYVCCTRARDGVMAFVARCAVDDGVIARAVHAAVHHDRYHATLLILRHARRHQQRQQGDKNSDDGDDSCGGALSRWSLHLVLPPSRLADDDDTHTVTTTATTTTTMTAHRRRLLLLQLLVFNVAAYDDDEDDADGDGGGGPDRDVIAFAHPHSAFYVVCGRRDSASCCNSGSGSGECNDTAATLYFVLHLHLADACVDDGDDDGSGEGAAGGSKEKSGGSRGSGSGGSSSHNSRSGGGVMLSREEAVLRAERDVCVSRLRCMRRAWSLADVVADATQLASLDDDNDDSNATYDVARVGADGVPHCGDCQHTSSVCARQEHATAAAAATAQLQCDDEACATAPSSQPHGSGCGAHVIVSAAMYKQSARAAPPSTSSSSLLTPTAQRTRQATNKGHTPCTPNTTLSPRPHTPLYVQHQQQEQRQQSLQQPRPSPSSRPSRSRTSPPRLLTPPTTLHEVQLFMQRMQYELAQVNARHARARELRGLPPSPPSSAPAVVTTTTTAGATAAASSARRSRTASRCTSLSSRHTASARATSRTRGRGSAAAADAAADAARTAGAATTRSRRGTRSGSKTPTPRVAVAATQTTATSNNNNTPRKRASGAVRLSYGVVIGTPAARRRGSRSGTARRPVLTHKTSNNNSNSPDKDTAGAHDDATGAQAVLPPMERTETATPSAVRARAQQATTATVTAGDADANEQDAAMRAYRATPGSDVHATMTTAALPSQPQPQQQGEAEGYSQWHDELGIASDVDAASDGSAAAAAAATHDNNNEDENEDESAGRLPSRASTARAAASCTPLHNGTSNGVEEYTSTSDKVADKAAAAAAAADGDAVVVLQYDA